MSNRAFIPNPRTIVRNPNAYAFPARQEPYPNGTPLRPPLAKPQARVIQKPVPCVLAPVPINRPVVLSEVDIPLQIREWWSAGVSPRVIAQRLNVAAPCESGKWTTGRVRRVIIQPVQKLAA